MRLFDLCEGINDKGIFKAIFLAGLPGSGKSYTISKITSGSIQPRIVNTDKMLHLLSGLNNVPLSKEFREENKELFRSTLDKSKILTMNQLYSYIDGMLPLIIDGTGNNMSNLLHRVGILESVGYDVGMVYVNTPVEMALQRAAGRARHVPPEFIRDVDEALLANKKFYSRKFHYFIEVDNDRDNIDDSVFLTAFKRVTSFFSKPVENPIGIKNINTLHKNGLKYLHDLSDFDDDIIQKKTDGWFKK